MDGDKKKAHTHRHIKPQPQKPPHLCFKQEKRHVNEINENDHFTMSGSNDGGMTSRLRDYITDSQPKKRKGKKKRSGVTACLRTAHTRPRS